jgi:hypothetical protein
MTVNHVQRATGPNAEHVAYPVLTTRRFQFRPFVLADIAQMVSIAGRHRIADTTIGVCQSGYDPTAAAASSGSTTTTDIV